MTHLLYICKSTCMTNLFYKHTQVIIYIIEIVKMEEYSGVQSTKAKLQEI